MGDKKITTFKGGLRVTNKDGAQLLPVPLIPDSEATTIAALKEDFNELLAVLKAAGVMEEA